MNTKTEVNTPDSHGITPLHRAAIDGNYHRVHELLSVGADPNIMNNHQQVPVFCSLMVPIMHDNSLIENKIKIFRFLWDKAPDTLNLRDDSGDTVVHQMALHEFSTLLAELLKTNPELAFVQNNHTKYPIHVAILNNQTDNVRMLLKIKEVAELADSKGRIALHYAARSGGEEMVTLCRDATKNLDARDEEGATPMMFAAQTGNRMAMRILMSKGANSLLTDNKGFSLLHYAVYSGDIETVLWVLDNTSIDINLLDNYQKTALSLCTSEEFLSIKQLLLERGAISIQ